MLWEEVENLIEDKARQNKMVGNMANIFPENSSKIIAEDLINMIRP